MPVRVLFLTLKTFGFTGGIEKVCRTLCRVLFDLSDEKLITAKVYSMYDRNADRDSRYILKTQFKGFNANRKWFVLKSIFSGLKSDVIVLSHIHLLNIGYLIKKLQPNKKVYLIAHGIEIWKKIPSNKLKFLKSLDQIICVSQFTADQIEKNHGIENHKITVVNNCLDPFYYITQNFEKPVALLNRYQLTSKNTVLFCLSRLSSSEKYKGYDHNIEILPSLLKQYPNLIYLLGGKWDTKEKERLDSLIKKHNLIDQVRLIGFIDEAEITDHFLVSDIFCMPSKKEGFGIVFIEAIICGLQVIAGNKDGSVDAVKNGALGALVDPDDLQNLEQTIKHFLAYPQTKEDKLKLQQRCLEAFNFKDYKEAIKGLLPISPNPTLPRREGVME